MTPAQIKKISKRQRVEVACRYLKMIFDRHDPIHKLMFAVIEVAIKDAFIDRPKSKGGENAGEKPARNKEGAIHYLRGDIVHAAICNIEPQAIRRALERVHLYV